MFKVLIKCYITGVSSQYHLFREKITMCFYLAGNTLKSIFLFIWLCIAEESHGGLMETEGGPYSNTLNKTMIARVFIMDIFFVIT
jgi:hypothetical protein